MSLDVYLTLSEPPDEPARHAIYVRRDGATVEISLAEWNDLHPGVEPAFVAINPGEGGAVYSANITHNLSRMAGAAGIYEHLWRPEEIGVTHAAQLIEPLAAGLELLRSDPPRFQAFNSPNGWGLYENFVPFVERYLDACRCYPTASVHASR
jgi:hypothetical protein